VLRSSSSTSGDIDEGRHLSQTETRHAVMARHRGLLEAFSKKPLNLGPPLSQRITISPGIDVEPRGPSLGCSNGVALVYHLIRGAILAASPGRLSRHRPRPDSLVRLRRTGISHKTCMGTSMRTSMRTSIHEGLHDWLKTGSMYSNAAPADASCTQPLSRESCPPGA
jgi:hypothetical protein